MEPVGSIPYLLQHAATMMIRQSDQILQERLGIGMSQLRILMMLADSPGIRQRKLAENLGQTEASVSRQIKLLQEKRMLSVRVNPDSRREHLTEPTKKGATITQAALAVLDVGRGRFEGLQRPFTRLTANDAVWRVRDGVARLEPSG